MIHISLYLLTTEATNRALTANCSDDHTASARDCWLSVRASHWLSVLPSYIHTCQTALSLVANREKIRTCRYITKNNNVSAAFNRAIIMIPLYKKHCCSADFEPPCFEQNSSNQLCLSNHVSIRYSKLELPRKFLACLSKLQAGWLFNSVVHPTHDPVMSWSIIFNNRKAV